MKISLVTISYNQAEFLERTLKSVVQQKADVNLDYIVVDPGSEDGSRDIIDQYRHSINQLVLDSDEGPSDGLNKGFALAQGDIFGFLNSDDILYPGALKKVISLFEKHPEADVISGHGYVINSNDDVIRKCFSRKMSLKKCAYGAGILIQPSTFFRKEAFFHTSGFNNANRSNWDGELFIDMALKDAKFIVCDEFWSGYRLHNVSITGTKKLDSLMRNYQERMFNKIMGRPINIIDRFISIAYILTHFAISPAELWERITKGRIYGRTAP